MGIVGDGSEDDLHLYIAELRRNLPFQVQGCPSCTLIGRTGTGKSSTINSIFGKEMAKVGAWEPMTRSVEEHQREAFGGQFRIVDTPGLCDDLKESGNDQRYIELMREKVAAADCIWFVTRLDETRMTGDEKRVIQLITAAYGKTMWSKSLILFTFGDRRRPGISRRGTFRVRKDLIQEEIGKLVGPGIARGIPAVVIDNAADSPAEKTRLNGELLRVALERMLEVEGVQFVPQPPIRLDSAAHIRVARELALRGASLGSLTGGPVGAMVGAAVGGHMAVIKWFMGRSFGAAPTQEGSKPPGVPTAGGKK